MNRGILETRAIFILMIFLFHAGLLPIGGTFGVCCFFILGGFCSYIGYSKKLCANNIGYKRYLFLRLSKFYPLHWLLLIPSFISELFTGYSLVNSTIILCVNAMLLQSLVPLKEYYFSYNAVSWYLSDTVVLICLFPFICRFINRLSNFLCSLLFIILIFAELVMLFAIPDEYKHYFMYINPFARMIDFALGIYMAKLISSQICQHRIHEFKNMLNESFNIKTKLQFVMGGNILIICLLYVIFIVSTLFLNKISSNIRYLSSIYWFPGIILMVGFYFFADNNPVESLVQKFGTISFEFFMTHQLVMNTLTKVNNIIPLIPDNIIPYEIITFNRTTRKGHQASCT